MFLFLTLSVSVICFAGKVAENNISMQNNHQAEKYIKRLYGSWKIIDYKWSGMSAGEANEPPKHIGATLFFGADHAQLINVSDVFLCRIPTYHFHKETNADKYLFNNYRARSAELGIQTINLSVIGIKCEDEKNLPGTGYNSEVFIIGKDKAILVTEGPFYYLQKVSDEK